MKKESIIKDKEIIIRLLYALFPHVKIYLFGSCAKETQQYNSDIDLALDAGRKLILREWCIAENVLDGLNMAEKIDIIDLQGTSEEFKKLIEKDMIPWIL